MEKKRLGRGLDDISDIFLSTRKEKQNFDGFSSEKLRDATCESCTRIVRDSDKAPKCRIFTFESKKYGVGFMDTISLTNGGYCEYFEPVYKKYADNGFRVEGTSPNTEEINCEIEENVIVRKNIAFPNTPYAQQDLLKSLSTHLEENYSIQRIELTRADRTFRQGMKKSIEETITIYIYGSDRRI